MNLIELFYIFDLILIIDNLDIYDFNVMTYYNEYY